MKNALFWVACVGMVCVTDAVSRPSSTCCTLPFPEEKTSESAEASATLAKKREPLSKLQAYVGQWRGVGQPKRGSTKDSWVEKSDWAWHFAEGDVSLQMNSEDAKFFRNAHLRPSDKAGEYELVAKTASGGEIKYVGKLEPEGLVLSAAKQLDDAPARISIRLVADGDRMNVLYERLAEGNRYTRMAEVGSTRLGSGFGKGTSYVECVVTGGLGTIAVTHEGKTYYVCCTGCRDYFNDNPKEVLAEYRARKEAEKTAK